MIIARPSNALPFSGVGAAKPAQRFYTMSLRRPHPLQRLVGQRIALYPDAVP